MFCEVFGCEVGVHRKINVARDDEESGGAEPSMPGCTKSRKSFIMGLHVAGDLFVAKGMDSPHLPDLVNECLS